MNLTEHFQGLCQKPDEELLEALIKAHYTAARDNANLSKQIVGMAGSGNADFSKSAAAGLLSIGGLHGPIFNARRLLRNATEELVLKIMANRSLRLPGWGNSFFKNQIDPAWAHVVPLLQKRPIWEKIEMIDKAVKKSGKDIYPNAGIFSAACMEELEWVDGTEMALILVARVPVWALEFDRVSQLSAKIADI